MVSSYKKRRFFMDNKLGNSKVLYTSSGSNINRNPEWNNLCKSCDAINVEKIHNPSQQPVYQCLKIFHQNSRILRNKSKELLCHLHYDSPLTLGLTEHHLNFEELEITHLGNYSLGTNYCRKTLLKWGIHKNIRFTTIT